MDKLLKNIRNKPSIIKNNLAFIIALILTGIIVVFWVESLSDRFSKKEIKEDLKPFNVLKENILDSSK